MKTHSLFFYIVPFILISLLCTGPSPYAAKRKDQAHTTQPRESVRTKASRTKLQRVAKDPYLGAIVIDAATDRVLFEDNADVLGYPASMVKLMNLLIILEAVEAKKIHLQDEVTVTAESARIGGSQVYLKEQEVFTVNDLLYAMTVQSANDAAAALALHYAGSREAFVRLMNRRARELGMKDTVFHSVHGLPPGRGQLPDVSTPRDITKLSLEVLKHPEALKYTSTKVRPFRTNAPEPFIMRNRNQLVGKFEGCDGLKTGYFRAAGFSIAATAAKDGKRAIAVVMGSVSKKVRNANARRLLSKSISELATALPSFFDSAAGTVTAALHK